MEISSQTISLINGVYVSKLEKAIVRIKLRKYSQFYLMPKKKFPSRKEIVEMTMGERINLASQIVTREKIETTQVKVIPASKKIKIMHRPSVIRASSKITTTNGLIVNLIPSRVISAAKKEAT